MLDAGPEQIGGNVDGAHRLSPYRRGVGPQLGIVGDQRGDLAGWQSATGGPVDEGVGAAPVHGRLAVPLVQVRNEPAGEPSRPDDLYGGGDVGRNEGDLLAVERSADETETSPVAGRGMRPCPVSHGEPARS